MADYLSGLLGGFLDRKAEVEQRNFALGQQASQKEASVFSTLMGSDDPEVRALAVTGLLDTANPRRKAKGLRGWIGETEASPYLEQMRTLINTPVTRTTATPLPGEAQGLPGPLEGVPLVKPTLMQTPGAKPGAMPATSLVEQTQAPQPQPPQTYQQSGPPILTSVTGPRQLFLTGADKIQADALAKELGELQGQAAMWRQSGFSDAEIKDLQRTAVMRRLGIGAADQSIAGEMPDEQGVYHPAFGVFDRLRGVYMDPSTHMPLPNFRPRTAGASATLGVQIEPLAHLMYGKRGVDLSQTELSNVFNVSQELKQRITPERALQLASQYMPAATMDQKFALANSLVEQTKGQPIGPVTPGGPPAPTPTVTPTAAPGATPTAPPASSGTPAAAPAAKPQAGGLTPPTGMGSATQLTGKPPAPQVQQAIARTQQMNDTIDRALAALQPYAKDSSLQGTINLVGKYRAGTEDNPIALAAAQLGDLAGLQQAASTTLGGASRSQRIYADRRQHTPRLPSGRQAMIAQGQTGIGLPALGANLTSKLSQLREGDAGGWDSPATMYLKLQSLKQANLDFLKDMEGAAQLQLNPIAPVPSHTPTGGPPAPGAAPQPVVYPKDAHGNYVIP